MFLFAILAISHCFYSMKVYYEIRSIFNVVRNYLLTFYIYEFHENVKIIIVRYFCTVFTMIFSLKTNSNAKCSVKYDEMWFAGGIDI